MSISAAASPRLRVGCVAGRRRSCACGPRARPRRRRRSAAASRRPRRRPGSARAAACRSPPGEPKPELDRRALGVDRLQRGADDRDRQTSTKSAAAEQRRDEALAGDRLPERLLDAADVGGDEDVEDHHRAGVDHDLRRGDELARAAAGRARRARSGGRSARARCRRGCGGRSPRSRRRGRRSRRRRSDFDH